MRAKWAAICHVGTNIVHVYSHFGRVRFVAVKSCVYQRLKIDRMKEHRKPCPRFCTVVCREKNMQTLTQFSGKETTRG